MYDYNDQMDRACSTHGENRNAYGGFLGKPEEKRPLARHRHRWKDNIERDVKEIEWCGMDWFHMAQDREQWKDLNEHYGGYS
jgi:hypothetical protein